MQAFEAAWAAACKVEASTVIVPAEFEFLVRPISFSGPYCEPNIVFQVLNNKKVTSKPSRSFMVHRFSIGIHLNPEKCFLNVTTRNHLKEIDLNTNMPRMRLEEFIR